jgi:hypothetical protein
MSEFGCGWIEIIRTSQTFARLRSISIFVDETKAGSLKNGERKVLELPSGEHQVFAKIDYCKTPAHTLNIVAGETTSLLCGSEIAGWKLPIAWVYLFMPSRVIYLRNSAEDSQVQSPTMPEKD